MGEQCPYHSSFDDRLRNVEESNVLTKNEVEHMKEKIDLMAKALDKLAEAVADLKTFQVKLTLGASLGFGVLSAVTVFVIDHWPAVSGLLK